MLSVLTLNLWHDSGPYERRAELIREWVDRLAPDLIGFQEALRGPDADQTTELLDGRGYHVEYKGSVPFWKEESRWRGGEFGNAGASRWPIAEREEAEAKKKCDEAKKKREKAAEEEILRRWRMEPSDPAAYARGELVEPVKPIVYWLDRTIPLKYRDAITAGIFTVRAGR